MEFKKVTIKNYRIHKEQVVEFDACLTLVGGENEKGNNKYEFARLGDCALIVYCLLVVGEQGAVPGGVAQSGQKN